MHRNLLQIGDRAPWFITRSTTNSQFHFDTIAGRYVVLCFFESAGSSAGQALLAEIMRNRRPFDDENLCFCGVSIDPDDEQQGRIREHLPGIRFFWDFDRGISRRYGATIEEAGQATQYLPHTLVLDPRLRVIARWPHQENAAEHTAQLLEFLSTLPQIAALSSTEAHAPVLIVPRVFEPQLCRKLMQCYDEHGGSDSGFVRDINGKTAVVQDYHHKRRRDQTILDESLRNECMYRIHDRLVPELHMAFQFRATRIERYIVACYEAETGGHFRPHRDNTTKGTAHRRFAVSVNLNTGEYEGGSLRFPEFGHATYCAPACGAVVFSCSLLHEATPVTHGKRYAFLPFLYDDAAAQVRAANLKYVAQGGGDRIE